MFILSSFFGGGQQSNFQFHLAEPYTFSFDNDDVNGITKFNFKRKRFAGNTIYAELGGFGYYYSINYELTLQSVDRRVMNLRIGGGLYSDEENGTKASKISLPVLLYLGFGETNMLDVGIGITYRIFIENEIIPSASVGFRHQKAFGGLMYRFAFTPTIETDVAGYKVIQFWGGVSVGYAF